MAVVVDELIGVVFVDIQRLMLNRPARASALDDHGDIGGIAVEVSNPTLVLEQGAACTVFPDLDSGHAHRALQR